MDAKQAHDLFCLEMLDKECMNNNFEIKKDIPFEFLQKKRTLFIFIVVLGGASLILGITNTLYFFPYSMIMSGILLFGSLTSLFALWLNFKNHYIPAGIITLIILFGAIFYNLFDAGGLRDPGIVAVPVAIIFSGMIFGRRAVLWITGASLIPLLVLAYIEIGLGLIPPYNPPTVNTIIVIVVITIATAFIMLVIMNNHETMMARIRENVRNMEISEKRYRTIFNAANDAIFIQKIGTGEILDVNERMCEMYGYTREEAVNLAIEQISSGEEPFTRKQAMKYIKKASDSPQLFEWHAKDSNGNLFWVEVNMRVAQLLDEPILLVLVRNINARKKTEEQLLHAQKLQTIGMLSSGIAHDFNNSLTGITAAASFIRNKMNSGASINNTDYRENIDIIEESAAHLGGIVKQLLMFSRKDKVVFGPVELIESIDRALKIVQSSMNAPVEIVWKKRDEPAYTYGNSTQIEQVLINLSLNGIHAMTIMRDDTAKQGGTLTISVMEATFSELMEHSFDISPHNKYWKISIRDTGVGMSQETIKKIFDPFYSTKKQSGGSGLGLAMVQSILMRHAAYLDINSAEGKGSEFSLFFPATLS
ncbi:MAG: PAS domain S-box protein [Spirochaetales bacterium]|nr:PAS domain S-box protein [Spirochaetales bacterium]